MPPSASMNLSRGCFCSWPEKTRSDAVHIRLVAYTAKEVTVGASSSLISALPPVRAETDLNSPPLKFGESCLAEAENPGTKLPDPKCRLTTTPVSSKTSQSGPQWSLWNEGRPSGTGLSGNDTTRAPLAATRFSSVTQAWTSHIGSSASGTYRPGAVADHSSMLKSFQACRDASARSLSFAFRKTRPPKPGKEGKQHAACTPSTSMSLTRSTGS